MRRMAGEVPVDEVEQGVRRRILGYLREGHLAWINPAAFVGQPIEGEWASTWASAKILFSLAETAERERDRDARNEARAVFEALRSLADWASGDRPPLRIDRTVCVTPLVQMDREGNRLAALLLNTGYDAIGPLEVRLRATFRNVMLYAPQGDTALPLRIGGKETVITVQNLPPLYYAVLVGTRA